MALLKTRLTSLPRRRRSLMIRMLLVLVSAWLLDFCASLAQLSLNLRLPLQLVMAIALYYWLRSQSIQLFILSAGIAAERAALQLLSRLPDTVTIYSDITLRAGNETAQIDHLLITPAGVFVLEAKSWRGVLRGDGNQNSWALQKAGRAGGRYTKHVPNPFGQLDRQVRVVRRLVAQIGMQPAVTGLLLLPYKEAQVEVRNQRHQVVVGEQVLRVITRQPRVLKRFEFDELVSLLERKLQTTR